MEVVSLRTHLGMVVRQMADRGVAELHVDHQEVREDMVHSMVDYAQTSRLELGHWDNPACLDHGIHQGTDFDHHMQDHGGPKPELWDHHKFLDSLSEIEGDPA